MDLLAAGRRSSWRWRDTRPSCGRTSSPSTWSRPEGVEPTDDWTPDSLNLLYLWVEEPDGRITEITLDGDVGPEVLIQVAESLFAGDGSAN